MARPTTVPVPHDWENLPDEALLDLRLCDLPVSIAGSGLDARISALYEELAARGLTLRRRWAANFRGPFARGRDFFFGVRSDLVARQLELREELAAAYEKGRLRPRSPLQCARGLLSWVSRVPSKSPPPWSTNGHGPRQTPQSHLALRVVSRRSWSILSASDSTASHSPVGSFIPTPISKVMPDAIKD